MTIYVRPGDTIRVITASGKSKPARVRTTPSQSSLTVKVGTGAATTVTKSGSSKDLKRLFS